MVSVVIPLYNKEKYIQKTLTSVFKQTFQDFEIIIVNDGSTDNSLAEVKKFNDKRIRIISQKNAGVSAARNKGIYEAQYELIAFMDADDEWFPNHLEELLALKTEFPECKIFATNYKIIDSEGKERFPVNTELFNFDGSIGIIKDYFYVAANTAPPLWTSAIAVDKESIQQVDCFPVGIRLGEDLLVWALLALRYKIAYSNNITAIYNVNAPTGLMDDEPLPDQSDVVGERLRLLLSTDTKNKSLRHYISLWHRMRYSLYISNFFRAKALDEILKAVYFNPMLFKNYILLFLLFLPHNIRIFIMKKRLKIEKEKIS